MVTVWPGFFCSNRRLASNSTLFLLSSIAQWLHHWSSTACAADAAASARPAASINERSGWRMTILLGTATIIPRRDPGHDELAHSGASSLRSPHRSARDRRRASSLDVDRPAGRARSAPAGLSGARVLSPRGPRARRRDALGHRESRYRRERRDLCRSHAREPSALLLDRAGLGPPGRRFPAGSDRVL